MFNIDSILMCVLALCGVIVLIVGIVGPKLESEECHTCPVKGAGYCINCSNDRYNRGITGNFKIVWNYMIKKIT